ncbi:uncharacterized protein LOC115622866 isoform X2 [Scaptodrosophila lebanonensis]|nr:uncharacterized protein LOC115622866 isoform X2 [Scaptodrosophila lebanonensis]
MHSSKQSCRLWWQYAYKCVSRNGGADAVWNPNLKFKLHCNRKLRMRTLKVRRAALTGRQPLRLHIRDIELLCQVRGKVT